MNKDYAQTLLKQTYQDYNRIASWFSKTRAFAWPELKAIKDLIREDDRVLDLGCGNGRLLEVLRPGPIDYLGVDISENLIRLAKEKYPGEKFRVVDALNLPFEDNRFDKVICLAVLHHFPSWNLRIELLKQAQRVLEPGGLLFLSVWNLNQPRFFKYHLRYFVFKISGRSRLDFKDIFYPFKNQQGEVLTLRYLHGFSRRELKRLAAKAGLRVESIGFLRNNKANLYLLASKK